MFVFQMFLSFAIVLSLSRSALAITTATLQTVSITNDLDYIALRTCAAYCIYYNYVYSGEYIPKFLGCAHQDDSIYIEFYNTCFCNTDYIPQATSFLGSCISSACSDGIDVPAAITVWENYCTTAGYPMNNVAEPTTIPDISVVSSTVTAANGQASTILVTVTPTAGTTETQTLVGASTVITFSTVSLGPSESQSTSANTETTPSKNSNLGPIIGGAIGGALILGISATIITWMILCEKRKRRAMKMTAPPTGPTFFPASGPPSGRTRSKPQEGLISRISPATIPFVEPAAAPLPAPVSVSMPADPRIGLIPLSSTSLPARPNFSPGPPGYSEHDGREVPEFVETIPEMQGIGRNGLGQWEMQG
jgi:hypothetical protein